MLCQSEARGRKTGARGQQGTVMATAWPGRGGDQRPARRAPAPSGAVPVASDLATQRNQGPSRPRPHPEDLASWGLIPAEPDVSAGWLQGWERGQSGSEDREGPRWPRVKVHMCSELTPGEGCPESAGDHDLGALSPQRGGGFSS